MANKTFNLTISRVDEPVFAGEAISVAVPGVAGDMVILAEHEPLISPLKAGTVRYTTADGSEHTIETTGGTLEVAHNHATVLL
jgi:F-type H+-transporting ATPase subunit epsilon